MKVVATISLLFFFIPVAWGQETDSLSSEALALDTLKSHAKEVALDSLRDRLGSVADSTITDDIKSRAVQAAKDSLDGYVDVPNIKIDSTSDDRLKEVAKEAAKSALQEELKIDIPEVALDSTLIDHLKSEAKMTAEEELGIEVDEITIDSTTTDQIKDEAEKKAEDVIISTDEYKAVNDLPKDSELGKLEDYKSKLENTQEQIKQAAAEQELKQKMTSHTQEHFANNTEKIQQVQSQVERLKAKYSSMLNSNDLSSAVKRNSLKEDSFWKRLVIGGNFNISKTNPVSLDLSPVLGYKINRLFEVGITGVYRSQFNADRNGTFGQSGNEVYGYSAFVNHMVFRNFFGYLEAERMRTTNLNKENPERQWKQTLLIGFGRKFNVTSWLEMQALILYNVLHNNTNGLYNSPVVFKTGFRVRK